MEKDGSKISGALKGQIGLEARIVEEDKFSVAQLSGRFYIYGTIIETKIRFLGCFAKFNSLIPHKLQ